MKMNFSYRTILLAILVACLGILYFDEPAQAQEEAMPLTITSTVFKHGDEIPEKYTCQGQDIAPPLQWSGVPDQAVSLVLIVDDPDAPDPAAPRMTWVHWVVYNIPPELAGLPEGVTPADLPVGAKNGINDWHRIGYGGPCPPIGRHRYFHKLYALDIKIDGLNNPTKADIEAAMKGHIIAQTELMGTYQKSK